MDKRNFEKIKEHLPEMEQFTRRYMTETLTAAALIIGAFSAWKGFFFGGPFSTLLFLAIGSIAGVFFPSKVDSTLKTGCQALFRKNRANEIVVGSIGIIAALFIPFAYFGLIGLFAGTSYHHYARGAQSSNSENRGNRAA